MTDSQNNSPLTMLAVLAHPDDETFGMGGTLALYSQRGIAVHLVCATRGEAGDVPAEMLPEMTTIAEMRESELRCAAQCLGLTGVHFLGYRDSGMAGSPDNTHPQALVAQRIVEVAAKVAGYIRKLKPQVVITFDPIGGYRHPDHIAIQKATVLGFKMAADPVYMDPGGYAAYQPAKLYFQTINRGLLRVGILLIRLSGKDPRKFGHNGDIDIVSIAEENFPIHAVIDYSSVVDLRDKASACHASQGGQQMAKGVQKWLRNLYQSKEQYMQAYPLTTPQKPVKDLFDGIARPK